jgi:ATP-dependent DNA helicase RecG
MRRLLQGEVGSGKTVVALRAMLRVVDSGAQAALLAPTEVLAQQHHRSITAMLGDLAEADRLGAAAEATRVALLTGSMPAAARKEALLEAASGAAGIVIGTHAILEEHVQFAELGLVVVDEQHRFGVEQRAALSAKTGGLPPHELVMTATPIPRTVAMTVFGDLETSALTELPAGRRPIQSTVVPLADQPAWFDRVWARVREEVGRGHQVYVVCPRISAGDDETASDPGEELLDPDDGQKRPLAAVEVVAPALSQGALSGLRVGTLHGRLHPDEKDRVMRSFAAGEVDVLVSTTVIEVGVDVGNATTMVILDAERFGVSQLHQLRGRVGRGGHPGLCLLVTSAPPGSAARVRLDAVASTSDGFKLAELDLELRREGNVLGSQQSGRRSSLRLLSVVRDVDVIEEARSSATAVVEQDPQLEEHEQLRAAVAALARRAETDYLDKA